MQGGRGGTGHTLLYYIGMEGKEGGQKDKSKEENGTEDGRTKEQKKGKGDGKRKGKGTEDRRTKEQKQAERGTGNRGTRTGKSP